MLHIGEKLRAARQARNLSLRELAAKVDVSASLLNQIENGKANPSVMSLYNIAAALELPIDYFFSDTTPDAAEAAAPSQPVDGAPEPPVPDGSDHTASETQMPLEPVNGHAATPFSVARDQVSLNRASQSNVPHQLEDLVVRAENRAKIELMGGVTWSRLTPGPERGAEFLEVCYAVGANSGPAMSRHSGREFTLVLEGELLLELGFDRYVLRAGDSIIFDSTIPHRLINAGQVPMRAISVILNS